METAFYTLLILGILGIFDILYYHHHVCDLDQQPSSKLEVFVHFLRYPIYCFLFIYIANFRFTGYLLLIPIFFIVADIAVGVVDVYIEPHSRKNQGGLSGGESLLHFIFALLLGIFYFSFFKAALADFSLPSQILVDPPRVPTLLRLTMSFIGVGCSALVIHYLWTKNKYESFWYNIFNRPGSSQYDVAAGSGDDQAGT